MKRELTDLADLHDRATCNGDEQALRSVYATAARFWNNVREAERTVDELLEVRRTEWQHIEDLRFEDVRRMEMEKGYVQLMTVRGRTSRGVEVRIPGCLVVEVQDQRITRIDEYVNALHAMPILEALGLSVPGA